MRKMKFFTNMDELLQMLDQSLDSSYASQSIAQYIEKNYRKVVYLTASELANAVGVSQGSISYFFTSRGYLGYKEFLNNLRQFCSIHIPAAEELVLQSDDPHRQMIKQEIAVCGSWEPCLRIWPIRSW